MGNKGATVVATLDWPSLILGLGVITLATFAIALILYFWGQARRGETLRDTSL